jgi:hypothetical protein
MILFIHSFYGCVLYTALMSSSCSTHCTVNVSHVRALYYTKTLITNKCTKRVLSSIVTHSYMFRPCVVETCRSVLRLMIKLSLCICWWLVFLYYLQGFSLTCPIFSTSTFNWVDSPYAAKPVMLHKYSVTKLIFIISKMYYEGIRQNQTFRL